MQNPSNAPVQNLYLQVTCLATVGNISKDSAERIRKQVEHLERFKRLSETARLKYECLLAERKILGHASFVLHLQKRKYAYHFFQSDLFYVEASAILLDNSSENDTASNELHDNENRKEGVPVEVNIMFTYDSIGGSSRYGKSHLPMQLDHYYPISAGGGPKIYVSKTIKLSERKFEPTFERLQQQVDKVQSFRRQQKTTQPFNWDV